MNIYTGYNYELCNLLLKNAFVGFGRNMKNIEVTLEETFFLDEGGKEGNIDEARRE